MALQAESFVRILHAAAWAILIPAIASAQAQITGTVRDTSGAVLPGVTVEAASPALIEQVRAVVTDAPASIASSICVPASTASRSS